MKTCTKCGRSLPLENFHKHKLFKDGRRNICKSCACAHSRKHYYDNKKNHIKSCSDWQQKNKEKYKEMQKQYREKYKKQKAIAKAMLNQKIEAQKIITLAVYKGEIKKEHTCQICNSEVDNIHAFHADFSKPMNFIWVCENCFKIASKKRDLTIKESA